MFNLKRLFFFGLLIIIQCGILMADSKLPLFVPAFPGAEGGGSLSVGGRGGKVYEVTNLNDSGKGSLREAIEAKGPRIVVFKVSGTIMLKTGLTILNPYITIAGQTAPGGGIQLSSEPGCYNDLLRVSAHDVIIRYIRSRVASHLEEDPSPFSIRMAPTPENIYNVIFDHVSAAWATWDNFAFWSSRGKHINNVTVQWSIAAEPLYSTNEAVNFQIRGATRGLSDLSTNIDLHHNLITSGDHRNPIHGVRSGRIINNIIYNWNYYAIKAKGNKDIIGNYMKKGPYSFGNPSDPTKPETKAAMWGRPPIPYVRGSNPEILTWLRSSKGTSLPPSLYIESNASNSNNFNPNSDQWIGHLTGIAHGEDKSDKVIEPISSAYKREKPLSPYGAPITIDNAIALTSQTGILLPAITSERKPGVGASCRLDENGKWVANRDSLDTRYVAELGNGNELGTGTSTNIMEPGILPVIVSGKAYKDSDHDGISDAWEIVNGLNPLDSSDSSKYTADGYTYIEHFINGSKPPKDN